MCLSPRSYLNNRFSSCVCKLCLHLYRCGIPQDALLHRADEYKNFAGRPAQLCRCVGVHKKHLLFVLTSSACLVLFYSDGLWDGVLSGLTGAVFWATATRICSKQRVISLCCSHLAFSQSISLKYWLYTHTILLTRLLLGRILILFLSKRSNFHMFVNL